MSNKSVAAPSNINEIVYHSVTERQLIADIVSGARVFPASGKNGILLYGNYGTGKTTLARLLPDAIEQRKGGNLAQYDFIACGHGVTGTEVMKIIRGNTSHIPINHCFFHIFVLDEIDNLTDGAQASLKAAMGLPRTLFIMTTNYIGKVNAGVLSRCVRVNCDAAIAQDYLPFARNALIACGANSVSDDKLLPLIEQCRGSVRDIADAMQSIAAVQRVRAKQAAVA